MSRIAAPAQTRFKPGQSGNPSGRSKVVRDVEAAAREHTNEALATLVAIMLDAKASDKGRVSAANSILDRGYGKAKQQIDANIGITNQLADLLEAARKRIA